jgi:hypothetical protein
MAQIVNHLKDVVGALGVLGTIVNFWTRPQAKFAIPLGILFALFILIWSILERHNPTGILSALAWFGIFVSIAAEIFFISVGAVVLLRSSSDPGKVVLQTHDEFALSNNRSGKLSHVYPLKLVRQSSLVEIGVAPAPADLAAFDALDATPQVDSTIASRMAELVNKKSALQTYYRLTEPTTSLTINLQTVATLKNLKIPSPIHVHINCTYFDRDRLWEIRQWIFQNLNW